MTRPQVPRKRRLHSTATPKPSDDDISRMQALAAIGYSIKDIAQDFGLTKDQLDHLRERFPTVRVAIEKGRSLCRGRTYRCYMEQAFPIADGKPTRQGDPSLMIFFMKTKYRWKEPDRRVEIAPKMTDGKLVFQVNGQDVAPEQLAATLQTFYDAPNDDK